MQRQLSLLESISQELIAKIASFLTTEDVHNLMGTSKAIKAKMSDEGENKAFPIIGFSSRFNFHASRHLHYYYKASPVVLFDEHSSNPEKLNKFKKQFDNHIEQFKNLGKGLKNNFTLAIHFPANIADAKGAIAHYKRSNTHLCLIIEKHQLPIFEKISEIKNNSSFVHLFSYERQKMKGTWSFPANLFNQLLDSVVKVTFPQNKISTKLTLKRIAAAKQDNWEKEELERGFPQAVRRFFAAQDKLKLFINEHQTYLVDQFSLNFLCASLSDPASVSKVEKDLFDSLSKENPLVGMLNARAKIIEHLIEFGELTFGKDAKENVLTKAGVNAWGETVKLIKGTLFNYIEFKKGRSDKDLDYNQHIANTLELAVGILKKPNDYKLNKAFTKSIEKTRSYIEGGFLDRKDNRKHWLWVAACLFLVGVAIAAAAITGAVMLTAAGVFAGGLVGMIALVGLIIAGTSFFPIQAAFNKYEYPANQTSRITASSWTNLANESRLFGKTSQSLSENRGGSFARRIPS